MDRQLYHDALMAAIDQNLRDVQTLLKFAEQAPEALDKAGHVDRAIRVLTDVRAQMVERSRR